MMKHKFIEKKKTVNSRNRQFLIKNVFKLKGCKKKKGQNTFVLERILSNIPIKPDDGKPSALMTENHLL